MAKISLATISYWNRLEGSQHTQDYSRALKAEVRDALWMISRQWQMGEFQAEDSGSAVLAKVNMKSSYLNSYQAGTEKSKYDFSVPLETQVEHSNFDFELKNTKHSIDIRVIMGRQWKKILKVASGGAFEDVFLSYLSNYGFKELNLDLEEDILIYSDQSSYQYYQSIQGRQLDGYSIYVDFKSGVDKTNSSMTQNTKDKYIFWYENLFFQPLHAASDEGQERKQYHNPSWSPSNLEHKFSCFAIVNEGEKSFIADEYYHGQLDWYNLDVHNELTREKMGINKNNKKLQRSNESTKIVKTNADLERNTALTFLPTSINFPGMPNKRWWKFEDYKTNMAKIEGDLTKINSLLLVDFCINYSNDWFNIPFTLPIGTTNRITGMTVTNVFGETFWIEPSGKGLDEDWNKWGMFNLNVRGEENLASDLSLLILPTLPAKLESKPLEEIAMIRDEMANMVWGIELQIPLPSGKGKRGKEAGLSLLEHYKRITKFKDNEALIQNEAKFSYKIMNTVPENWIPFIPVHKNDDIREIQLQRGAVMRIFEGKTTVDPLKKVEPRTSILRNGLDEDLPSTYFIHEEEVTRSGIVVSKSFQRTRWLNGRVFTWLGRRKHIGRGEGNSGLAFDSIVAK